LKISNDIRIFIVEDDATQSEILYDKLLEYNPEYSIVRFKSGNELLDYLKKGHQNNKHNYLILDYYLQTTEDKEVLNGFEIIKLLGKEYSKIRIILFSAYESDNESNFSELTKEPNVIEFVRKTEHAYSTMQNILRFDYAQNNLLKKKRRFQWALSILLTLLALSTLHFIINYIYF